MNQSNKKNLEFIKNSGINYFLQDSPRNWFENTNKVEKQSNIYKKQLINCKKSLNKNKYIIF